MSLTPISQLGAQFVLYIYWPRNLYTFYRTSACHFGRGQLYYLSRFWNIWQEFWDAPWALFAGRGKNLLLTLRKMLAQWWIIPKRTWWNFYFSFGRDKLPELPQWVVILRLLDEKYKLRKLQRIAKLLRNIMIVVIIIIISSITIIIIITTTTIIFSE